MTVVEMKVAAPELEEGAKSHTFSVIHLEARHAALTPNHNEYEREHEEIPHEHNLHNRMADAGRLRRNTHDGDEEHRQHHEQDALGCWGHAFAGRGLRRIHALLSRFVSQCRI